MCHEDEMKPAKQLSLWVKRLANTRHLQESTVFQFHIMEILQLLPLPLPMSIPPISIEEEADAAAPVLVADIGIDIDIDIDAIVELLPMSMLRVVARSRNGGQRRSVKMITFNQLPWRRSDETLK